MAANNAYSSGGDIISRENRKKSARYAIISFLILLILGVIQTLVAGHFLEEGLNNRRILNIIVSPLQILQVAFLFLTIFYSGEFRFSGCSLWYHEKRTYHPLFVSARTFEAKLPVLILLFLVSLSFFVDWSAEAYQRHRYYIVILTNLLILTFAPVVSRWIREFLDKFDAAVNGIKYLFQNETEYEQYRTALKRSVFSRREIIPILSLLILIRFDEIIFPDNTWMSSGGYMYPFTLLWWSFAVIPIWNLVFAVLMSILHSYYQFSKSLTQLQKRAASIFLFHPDDHCGMKSIVDFVYYLSSRLLMLVVIGTVCWLVGIKYFPQEFSQIGIVGLIFIIDIFSLVILLVPLMTLRKIVKKKKEQERKIIMEKIRKKEENITLEKDTETFKDFEDLRNLFLILERVDSVNEWLIGKRIKISFSIESVFGFIPLMFELLRRSF